MAASEALAWARPRQEEMEALLRELVEMESPSTDPAGVDRLARRLAAELEELGLRTELLPVPGGGPVLRATSAVSPAPVMLLGHLDTVWPLGTLESRPLRRVGDALYGPGTFDMKGGLVVAVFALRALHERGPLPPLTVFFTPLEEVDCGPYRERMEADMRTSAAVLDFEPAWPGGAVKTERKGSGSVVVRAHGRAAHAGADFEKGANAILELARKTIEASALTDLARGVTVNAGVVRGGLRPNVVPDRAEVEIDFRVRTVADGRRVEQALHALRPDDPRVRLEVAGGLHYPPLERTPEVAALYETARAVAAELGVDLKEMSTGGASEASFAAALGRPTLDGLGPDGDGAHAEDEHVLLSSLPPRVALAAGLIARLAICLFAALAVLLPCAPAAAQAPPALEDFMALASRDDKAAKAAAARLAPVWKDGYAAMVLDLARFFRPARPASWPGADEDSLAGFDDPPPESAAPRGRDSTITAATRTPESLVRMRLMQFLARQTKKGFGDDLKRWRAWSWALPYDPHPEYAAFKARLYANVDPRMASFFEATTTPTIRLDEIDWGGVAVNGIPPLDHPKTIPAAEAKFMRDDNVVFGIVVHGEARAYPKRILAWHEMALDTLGGVELAVAYCTLCGTVIPYESVVGGRSFTFGTSGLLYRSNKLMFDLETKSLWSTLEGRPVVGPLAGSPLALKYRPVVTTTWKEWRTTHPRTTVLSLDTGHRRDYGEGAAYQGYFSHDELMFEVPEQDRRLKRKAEVVTFFAGKDRQLVPVALHAAFLEKNPVYLFSAGQTPYVALTTEGGANRIYQADATRFVRLAGDEVFDDAGRSWKVREDQIEGPQGEIRLREPARRTFWFAWYAQFPQTVLVK